MKKESKSIIVVILIILLIIAGGGVWYLFGGKTLINNILHNKNIIEHSSEKNSGAFLPMDEFVLDLISPGSKNKLLKLKVTLDIADQSDIEKIKENMPRIRDIFQTYLRSLRADDLKGSAGTERLREELLLRINKIVAPSVVRNVLFDNIVVN